LCDTGPRITPSALLAASSARSESVLPSARSAASPIDMGVKDRANPKARSAAASTFMVAAVISGPMPSPSITTMRTGANDGALTSFPPPVSRITFVGSHSPASCPRFRRGTQQSRRVRANLGGRTSEGIVRAVKLAQTGSCLTLIVARQERPSASE
jgi:hypothetical protein